MARVPGNKNVLALLDTLAYSEGTINKGDDGYNVLFGGDLFSSYVDHPRIRHAFGENNFTTAAGRYQLLARFYDAYRVKLHLMDFSPISQDLISIEQIKEFRAIPVIMAGMFDQTIGMIAPLWASLPGANYKGQRMNKLDVLRNVYLAHGGLLTPNPL